MESLDCTSFPPSSQSHVGCAWVRVLAILSSPISSSMQIMASERTKRILRLAELDIDIEVSSSSPRPVKTIRDVFENDIVESLVKFDSGTNTNEVNYGNSDTEYDDSDADKDYTPDKEEEDSSESDEINVENQLLLEKENVEENSQNMQSEAKSTSKSNKRSKGGVHSRKNRRERKQQRNLGKSYITAKGKEKKQREMQELPTCRMKCTDRIPPEVRKSIFREYWSLGDRNKRVAYVASLVDTTETATKRKRTADPDKEKYRMITHTYHFKVNGERLKVCRGCFMKTLAETQMFVTLAISNSNSFTSGITYDDQRGRAEPANKHSPNMIQDVIDHIKSFPSYKSHYTRRDNNKNFLAPHLTLQIMYRLYCEGREPRVSRRIYEREFHNMNLAFKQPKIDTCHKCDMLHMKLKVEENEEERKRVQEEIEVHHAEADNAYLKKDADKKFAKGNDDIRCYTFDLQQCLPTPYVNSSIAFYKRQLWTYNLTMHDLGSGGVTCYMWHEAEGARGGNQIGTCLFKQLTDLPTNIKHVVLYSDTCGGQNKNSHVAAMFLCAMQQNKNLEAIDHKFMVATVIWSVMSIML
ncbi:uncharacterized protein LOC116160704 [Photinus pyralis]|uniref:uncharacterized protein LOC116159092 n=2 Tax=Photinus pyralis TaxID=7054 RepID=UPI001267161F|nr:uncharacterized protein LOC116159092 [Photinus pyralis]XP_031329827.1 uncharacterized protein LOC116160704 [Photinus pyralis]